METFSLPCPSPSEEAPGATKGFSIYPLHLPRQEIFEQKSLLKRFQNFPPSAQAEILREQRCSRKDECCLMVRAQG